jgi:hypothetical protein
MNFAVYYHGIEQQQQQQNCPSSSAAPSSPSNAEKATITSTTITAAPVTTAPTISMTDHELDVVALAVAYHDIALWTDGALSYLEPSVAVLEREIYIPGAGRKKK